MWSRDHIGCGPKGNPATSTPGSVDFPTLPGFLFLAKVPVFSGLQPAGLQRGGEAPVWQVEKITSGNFRNFPVFFLAEMSYTLLRLQSPIIRIHGSQRDISSVADHERSD